MIGPLRPEGAPNRSRETAFHGLGAASGRRDTAPRSTRRRASGVDYKNAEAVETARIERLAMPAGRSLGYEPSDVSADRCGHDIESRVPDGGRLRFIEVKGRHKEGKTITVTRNEVLTALNEPEAFALAIVQVSGDETGAPRYVLRPFNKEPDFGVTSVIYSITALLEQPDALHRSGH